MNYTILMADILNSSKKDGKTLMSQLKKIVNQLNKEREKNILSPLTITLGDEFQGVLDKVETGINLIFEIEELIIKKNFDLKLRYVLNFGDVETKINKKIAYEMLGSGLTEARSKLNNLKKEDSRFFVSVTESSEVDYYINQAFTLYQSIVDAWKPKDLKTVSEFFNTLDYKEVAKKIKTDISSAWRRKKSLKINEYLSIKEIILYLASN